VLHYDTTQLHQDAMQLHPSHDKNTCHIFDQSPKTTIIKS
jgi:hypothetical protein